MEVEGCPHRWLGTCVTVPYTIFWIYRTFQIFGIWIPFLFVAPALCVGRARDMCNCELVPQDGSASVNIEITDGLFHACFVTIRYLWKDFPSPSGHQNHSYLPIWGSNGGGGPPTQVARVLCDCEMMPQDGSASVDTEITDGLFHACFVTIRQLWKDFTSPSGHQNHSYSPITNLGFQWRWRAAHTGG